MSENRIQERSTRFRSRWAKRQAVLCGALFFLLWPGTSSDAFLIGRLDVAPELVLEWMYDDNVWLRDTRDPQRPVVGDWVGRVRPGLTLAYDYGATDFSLGYLTDFEFYLGSRSLSDQISNTATRKDTYARNHDLTLAARHEFGPRTAVELEDTLQIGTDVADLVGALGGEGFDGVTPSGILPEPSDYRINRTGLSLTRRLTRRLSLVVGGGYRYAWYGEVVSSGVVTEASREEHHGDLTTGCVFAWHPRNEVNLNLRGAYMDFGSRGESKVVTFTVGDTWQITEAFSLTLNVGGQYLDQLREQALPIPVRATYVRPTGDAALSCVFRGFAFTLAGNAGISDSSGVATTVVSRSGRFTVSWEPLEEWTLEAFGLYSKDEAVSADEGLDTESYQGGGRIAYRFRSWIGAGFRYTYIDQQALGTSGSSYKDNRFILGVSLSLPGSLG